LLEQLLAATAWLRRGNKLMFEWLTRAVIAAARTSWRCTQPGQPVRSSKFLALHAVPSGSREVPQRKWDITRYAVLLRVTPTRLHRLCLRIVGKATIEIVHERLLPEACRQSTYPQASVATIAYELEFRDPAFFSPLFRKRYGVTPVPIT
jgi:AraC family transcriptional activator of pobA